MKIRRIVVGLDIAPQSRSALSAAASLAGELDADLEALFVESDELWRLSALPFARELGLSSAALRPMDAAALERFLQARVREARSALSALSAARALRWSLRVTRGSMAGELLAAAVGADLAVVGIARWGPEALRFAQGATATLLVPRAGATPAGPLAAVCPTGVAPAQAASLVGSIARSFGDGLTILALGGDVAQAGQWCEETRALLAQAGLAARFEIVPEGQAETLRLALARLAPRALLMVAPVAPPAG